MGAEDGQERWAPPTRPVVVRPAHGTVPDEKGEGGRRTAVVRREGEQVLVSLDTTWRGAVLLRPVDARRVGQTVGDLAIGVPAADLEVRGHVSPEVPVPRGSRSGPRHCLLRVHAKGSRIVLALDSPGNTAILLGSEAGIALAESLTLVVLALTGRVAKWEGVEGRE